MIAAEEESRDRLKAFIIVTAFDDCKVFLSSARAIADSRQ
jgi:hypothetical protein